MEMLPKDLLMLNGSLAIMQHTFRALKAMPVKQAQLNILTVTDDELSAETLQLLGCANAAEMRIIYGRKDLKDTLIVDAVAESMICLGGARSFGHYSLFQRALRLSGVVITEERGRVPRDRDITHNTPVIISDPIDGSSHLKRMIREHSGACKNMGEVFKAELKKVGTELAQVQAPNVSVTYLMDNRIKYALILNLLTGEIHVAYEMGIFSGHISRVKSISDISRPIVFRQVNGLSMLCYNQPKGKYQDNFHGTRLRFFNLDASIESPIGPMRFAYLMERNGKPSSTIDLLAYNGEKIQEALPAIAMAFFSQGQLRAWKLFCDPRMAAYRGEKAMTPVLQNSLYDNGLIQNTGIKLRFLNKHVTPSEFRDTVVIVPRGNAQAVAMMESMVNDDLAIRII